MKYLIFIPFAILLGLAAGSWAPKKEMAGLRKEIQKLKKERKSSGTAGKLSALNSIIKIPEKKTGRKPGDPKPSEVHSVEGTEAGTTATNAVASGVSTNTPLAKRHIRRRLIPDPKSKNFEVELDKAEELWETRVEMARSQWLAKLDLDDDKTKLFDKAFADMNEKLYLTMQLVAEELQTGKEMTNEAGLRIVNEVTTTLVETYDNLGAVVPEDKRPELEKMEMQDFIDPAAFEPLIDVRDKL